MKIKYLIKTQKYILFSCIIFTLLSCSKSTKIDSISKHNDPKIEFIGKEDMPSWTNYIRYTSFEEQLKNLDFKTLENNELSDSQKNFILLFQKAINGNELELINDLKETYHKLDEGNTKNIIKQMLIEYLNNQGRYYDAVDFLDLGEVDFSTVLASFPQEEFIALNETVNDTLIKSEFNHAIVIAEINGQKEEMLFDTGADWTLLSESRAKKMGAIIHENEFDLNTSTSVNVIARLGYIKDFKVGNVQIKNHHILVLNDESTIIKKDSLSIDVGAIFGWNGIRNLKVELDDIKKRHSIVLSKKKKESLNNFYWLGYPGLKVVAENGQALAFGFDSGSNKTEISENFYKKIPNLNLKKQKVKEGGIGGVEELEVVVVENVPLYLSNYKFTFKKLETVGDQDFFLVNQDGTVGIDILNKNVVTIDFINNELRID